MPRKIVSVPEAEIQARFNRRYLAAFRRGDLTHHIQRSGLADPTANQPPGTRSEMWWLYERDGTKIALVHVYVKPDGTLGASGKPDPKVLILGDTRYVLDTTGRR
jgi:hypothetical protein